MQYASYKTWCEGETLTKTREAGSGSFSGFFWVFLSVGEATGRRGYFIIKGLFCPERHYSGGLGESQS